MQEKATKHQEIVWFKRDIRVFDHAPLWEAAQRGRVLPLFIIEPDYWRLPDSSRRHWHFIHDSLQDLRDALAKLNCPLLIRVGEVTQVFTALHDELGAFSLWSHEETGNDWTFQRDKRVAQWCRENSVTWHERPTNGVVRRLKSREGWAKIRDERMVKPCLPAPQLVSFNLASHPLPAKDDSLFGETDIGKVQSGGRANGLKILTSFLENRSQSYLQGISKPGVSAKSCSRLSAHISFGTLSMREIEQATKAKIATLEGDNRENTRFHQRNLTAFLSRLAWQSHFVQKLEQQPDIEFKTMHPAFEGMREPHFRQDFLEKWHEGQTGYPLVDAAMRSLHATGWLNFRMRAMVVSFASYHLWLDWRKTAPLLAKLFTDYEPGIHYSQFQMQSGVTGINAIRMYNPIKQSYDNDPNGHFIRYYLPELAKVSDSFIHEPWKFSPTPQDYPAPLVAHENAMRFARQMITEYRKTAGFRTKASAVHSKLGSRKKQEARAREIPKAQLTFDL